MSTDSLADALARRLMEALPAGRPHGRAALTRLPGPVAHLLAAALDRRVARDAAPPASDWVDPADPAVVDAAARWREAARAAARYPAAAWGPALTDACRLAIRHLVDPGEGASAFCFAGERGEIATTTVLARLAAFGPYAYLREIVEEYTSRKGIAHLDRAGLEGLMRRIDRRMAESYGAADWAALLAPLYGLAEHVPERGGRVPTPLIRRFFLARGAERLADALPPQPDLMSAEVHAAIERALAQAPAVPPLRDLLLDPRDASAASRTPGTPPSPPPTPQPPASPAPVWPSAPPPVPPLPISSAPVLPSPAPVGGLADDAPTPVEPAAPDANSTADWSPPSRWVPQPPADAPVTSPLDAGSPDADDEDGGWEAVDEDGAPSDREAGAGFEDEREEEADGDRPTEEELADEELADDVLSDLEESEGWERVPDAAAEAPDGGTGAEPDGSDDTLDEDAADDVFGVDDAFDAPMETEPEPDSLDAVDPHDTMLDEAVASVDADEPGESGLPAESEASDEDEGWFTPDDELDDDLDGSEPDDEAEIDLPETDLPEDSATVPEDDADDWPAASVPLDTADTIDLSELLKRTPVPPPLRASAPPTEPPAEPSDEAAAPEADAADRLPDVEPLGQRLDRDYAELSGQPPPAPPPMVPGEPAEGADWQRFPRDPAGGLETLASVEARVLGPAATERRDWYVAHVAGGSESSYRSLLDALDDAESWEDAWPVLAAAFKRHRVDIYAEPAVAFTDAVEARYSGGP